MIVTCNWPSKPLGEICDVIAGGTPSRRNVANYGGGIPWVKIGDMLQNQIFETKETISQEGLQNSTAKLLPKGTLLISIFATIGRTSVLGIEASTNQAIVGLIPRSKNSVFTPFLRYYLNYSVTQLTSQARGVAQNNINGKILKALTIPLPPLPEQKRIAAILDKADAIRKKRKQAIDELNNLIPAIFYDSFGNTIENEKGWPILPLAEIVKQNTSVTYGIVQCGPHIEVGVPYVRTSDISNEILPPIEAFGRTSPELAAKFERSTVHTGELIFAIRATVGAVVIVPEYLDGANLTQGTARISPGENVTPDYLLWCLRSKQIQQWVDRQCKGATFKEITLGKLREIPIPLPPINLQLRFSETVQGIQKSKDRYEQSAVEADALFNSLVQQAFKGEL